MTTTTADGPPGSSGRTAVQAGTAPGPDGDVPSPPGGPPAGGVPAPFPRRGPGLRRRIESLPIDRIRGFATAAGLVAVGGIVHAVNMAGAPAPIADEGRVVTRAWAVDELGALSPSTYTYDHPPLGWLQLGAWARLTGALGEAPGAVAGGRGAMLAAHLVAAGLLWVLVRRLGQPRWAASLALVLYGLSPLAVQLHRQVSLDNLAVPWILGALVLACGPRGRPGALAASGACLGIAVLTSETALLAAPALALALWRAGPPATRRYALVTAGSLFAAVGGTFVLVAAARDQLLPRRGEVSLLGGAWHGLFGQPSSGSVLDGSSVAHTTVAGWLDLDPVGPVLALVSAVVAVVAVRRLAPLAVGFLVVVAAVVSPGYLPVALAAGLLPLGAALVAGVVHHAWDSAGPGRRLTVPVAGLVAAVVVLTAATWVGQHRALLGDDAAASLHHTERWMVANVPAGQRVVVDDALWVDLVEDGLPPRDLTAYEALDAEPDVGAAPVDDWRDHDVVVVAASDRPIPAPVAEAVRSSVVLAAFGTGDERVEVRRILPPGSADTGPAASGHDRRAAAGSGAALARNPDVELTPPARRALVAGEVDERLMTSLVALAADRPVTVDDFPVVSGEAGTGAPRRTVTLRAEGDAARAIADLVAAQRPPYRPEDVEIAPGGRVTVRYPLAALT